MRCVCLVVVCPEGGGVAEVQNPRSKRHPPLGVPAGGHREAGGVGAEWGARRRGTCAPLCFVQRATDLSACLSLASRFPPLGLEEPPPLLCAPTLCFPSPPESEGGGRAIGLLLPPVELSGWGETEEEEELHLLKTRPRRAIWQAPASTQKTKRKTRPPFVGARGGGSVGVSAESHWVHSPVRAGWPDTNRPEQG